VKPRTVTAILPDFVEPMKAKLVDSIRPAFAFTKSSSTVTAPSNAPKCFSGIFRLGISDNDEFLL
jgi:hypothetical protein